MDREQKHYVPGWGDPYKHQMIRGTLPALSLAFLAGCVGRDVSLDIRGHSVAVLLALPDGDAERVEALGEWADCLEAHAGVEIPPIWVLLPSNEETESLAQIVRGLPRLLPFAVEETSTWSQVLETFREMNQHADCFGLLGEGVLPPPDIFRSTENVVKALAGSESTPTVVLARSRSKADDVGHQEWLADTFIAQLWMNRRMLMDSVLEDDIIQNVNLLAVLPQLVREHRDSIGTDDLVLVDGTRVLTSVFDVSGRDTLEVSAHNNALSGGDDLYIGTLDLAIVLDPDSSDGDSGMRNATIATAPWPPVYILEAAVNDNGLVVVNSVNCGYLDFASNFLRSVRSVSDIKVLWVTTDEVAFDFMDDLVPGCAAALPTGGSKRLHSVKAGNFGGPTFASQVNVRPDILLHILNQGYTVLWTDSDMVWMSDPSLFLPDIHDPDAAELMVQWDGSSGHPCTCIMFMKPVESVKELVIRWGQTIVEIHAVQDQIAFQHPFLQAEDRNHYDIFPEFNFPAGKFLSQGTHEQNFARIHDGNLVVFHNNYIIGHERKLQSLKEFDLWSVQNASFPTC